MACTRTSVEKRLTDTKIKAWLSKKRPAVLHDGGGLYLRLRAGGAFWSLRQVNPKLRGRRTWAALFPSKPYPAATLADARREAAAARLRDFDRSTDLVRERKDKKEAKVAEAAAAVLAELHRVTVRQLFERWAVAELLPHTRADGTRGGRKDGGQYVREQFERRVFPKFGEIEAAAITKADLLAIIDAAKAEGKLRTAGVLLTDLKQMLAFAMERDIVPRNPLDTVRRSKIVGRAVERDRVLTAQDVAALAMALPASSMQPRSALAIWLILATGCRVGELMAAEWRHVDTTARTWYLPDTKNQRDHTIHLSEFAMSRLADLVALGQESPYLFPNAAGDGAVCVKSFGKQLADRQREPSRRMKHRATDTTSLMLAGGKWTAHDLRRTAATMMAGLGVSTDVIDECLNHKLQSKVARVYIKDRREVEQARAFDVLGAKLAALVDGVETSNVVHLRAA